MRNARPRPTQAIASLERLAGQAEQATDPAILLGIEGAAAKTYFGAFNQLLRPPEDLGEFDFNGRNRRPPKDRINALLSFVYSLLVKDCTSTLFAVGFDPYMGVYHRPRFGRPSLALDLAAEFRPIIADSTVATAINNGEITASDFVIRAGSVALTSAGRRTIIGTYERRLGQEVTHPRFGYRITYRRVLEVQARLLGAVFKGEIDTYPGFRTR